MTAKHLLPITLLAALGIAACTSARGHRENADDAATAAIERAQQQALGHSDPFIVRPAADTLRRRLMLGQNLATSDDASLGIGALSAPEQIKDREYLEQDAAVLATIPKQGLGTVHLDLMTALTVAARNSRDYQDQKESVFRTALGLDLERDAFRTAWDASAQSAAITDLLPGEDRTGLEGNGEIGATHRFTNGITVAGALGVDLVRLLTFNKTSSLGLYADASISIPLLRGSSSFIVTEPLRQAERDVIYAIYGFEQFKRSFAVDIASAFLNVLADADRVTNTEQNYRNLLMATRRARRLADAGRLPEIQVDQARQNELRARERWIGATEGYARNLDSFKQRLGLPVDARVELDPSALDRLQGELGKVLTEVVTDANTEPVAADADVDITRPERNGGGPWELDPEAAVRTALDTRLDLRTDLGKVQDALRRIAVAADDLRADLTLLGSGRAGAHRSLQQAGLADAQLRPDRGSYSLLLNLDLPLHRTAERNTYRSSWIALDKSVRDLQEREDAIKLAVRNDLRNLIEARESARIQAQALVLARRRVDSTSMFIEAGRAEIRDLLEAQESLVTAEVDLTTAVIRYRTAEWTLQRDLGVLTIDSDGLWQELRHLPAPADDDAQPANAGDANNVPADADKDVQ